MSGYSANSREKYSGFLYDINISLIVAHKHPSSGSIPSEEDIELTIRLAPCDEENH